MIPSRRSFLKFLAAAAAVPTLPAIGQKVEPDLDSYGLWLGLETIIRPQWKFGQVEEISGPGYARHYIPGREWRRVDRAGSIAMLWPGPHTFMAAGEWPLVDFLTLFSKGCAIWRHEVHPDGPYQAYSGDTIRVENIRITSDWGNGGLTEEGAITLLQSLLPDLTIRR